MGFFNKLRSDGETFDGQANERRGLVDVIQYNGAPDELVWKFPYNNLSTGAQLIVNKSQEAIFVKEVEPFAMSLAKVRIPSRPRTFRFWRRLSICPLVGGHLSRQKSGM